jgi:hypothetical protein
MLIFFSNVGRAKEWCENYYINHELYMYYVTTEKTLKMIIKTYVLQQHYSNYDI